MKATDHFKRTIQAYLDNRTAEDELFAVSYRKEGKNIDDCITYIPVSYTHLTLPTTPYV